MALRVAPAPTSSPCLSATSAKLAAAPSPNNLTNTWSQRVAVPSRRPQPFFQSGTRPFQTALVPHAQGFSWGDMDARDSDSDLGKDDDGYDRDTLAVILRVLTARATQRTLLHLQEVDMYSAHWLSNFISTNPPLEGNKFLLALYKSPALTHHDHISKKDHFISPTRLAIHILTLRDDMAQTLAGGLPAYSHSDSVELMRKQLESNSYVSGSFDKPLPKNQAFPRWNL